MKRALLILALLTLPAAARGQAFGAGASVVTVHSQNGRFYLRSVPFDAEFPSPRGVTRVYEKGRPAPLYEFERGFDSVEEGSNNLILSDDGETIFYAIPWAADEKTEGMKSVTIYKRGRIHRSYTESEVNGCDQRRERCSLLYNNYEQVVDRQKSNWGTANYRKAFKDGVSEAEKFLSDFALFGNGDTVYLTDSKRRTHLFDLKEGALVRSDAFDNLYGSLKGLARDTTVEFESYDAPTSYDFPRLRGGADAELRLAAHLGMTRTDVTTREEQFKRYSVTVKSTLRRDGSLEVEALEVDEGLPKEKVAEFFRVSRFDTASFPRALEKWYLGEQLFFFRKSDARLARRERREELVQERQEYERRLTAESIKGVYVPATLGEALAELDKSLTEINREEMRALPKREDMITYHIGLGTWMRNNWGLWGGSRLQKYFMDRGVKHPESMSTVILYHYHDWLNGRRETWREWEKKPGNVLK